ncbi:MAG: hypothetical protein GY895_21405 [Phycisphaera sp.]|nr:hypothetical protein [Phycisphaera sp.]
MPVPRKKLVPRSALVLLALVTIGSPILADDPPGKTRVLREGRFGMDEAGRATDGQVVAADPATERTIVAILPDRTTGEDWGLPHLDRAVTDLNLLRPDAVFCVGDLVQGYTRDPGTWDREVDEYLAIMDRLDAAFWPTAGNHDVISGNRDAGDRTFADRYRERFGPLHYAVELEHGTIVVLFSDENLDGGEVDISEAQVEWLEGVLGGADPARPIVLLMHRPLWRYEQVDWANRVHPMLARHGVDAVVAGHFHALHRDEDLDGVEYHLLGVCGGAIDQHPLTGQFNHLTLLDLGPEDEVHIRHLPSGVMLPDDFVRREDQDRAYRLKSGRSVRVTGTLADPRLAAIEGTVELEVRNPIDTPILVTVEAAREPEPWLVEGHAFVARTESDIANPSTTDLETPFQLAPPSPIEVAPGATAIIPLAFTADRTTAPPPPPEIRVRLEFEDSHGRRVPIMLARRIAVARIDQTPGDGGPAWPVAAWDHSVYEEREPLGSVTTSLVPTASGDRLAIDLTIFDDRLVDDEKSIASTVESRRNPHGDLVVIELETTDGPRSFLFEPVAGGGSLVSFEADTVTDARAGTVEDLVADAAEPDGHRFRIVIPGIEARSIGGIQIRVADNDRTYHTQWRSLAPTRGRLELDWPSP